jgi:heme/copper-type cytochrome/quinol oxidase subunit 3
VTDTVVHPPPHAPDAAHRTSTGLSNTKLAMWVYLGSDCLLFGSLISTYLLLRHRSVEGPQPHDVFDIPFTSVSSFVLLMSSLTMALAVAAIGLEGLSFCCRDQVDGLSCQCIWAPARFTGWCLSLSRLKECIHE